MRCVAPHRLIRLLVEINFDVALFHSLSLAIGGVRKPQIDPIYLFF